MYKFNYNNISKLLVRKYFVNLFVPNSSELD